ncbi:MAG: FHA domain-containing protein [Polyangiaceae bacterium]|nr:FHA domain-containing protein [Polyangiaceae bacterium]
MTLAIRAQFRSRDGIVQGDRTIHHLPARLGRGDANECAMRHPMVSEFHAVLEVVSGELCIRDLNSRNGVFDDKMTRLPPSEPVPLSSIGNAFILGRVVHVEVTPFDDGTSEHSEMHGRAGGLSLPSLPALSFAVQNPPPVVQLRPAEASGMPQSLPSLQPLQPPGESLIDPSRIAPPLQGVPGDARSGLPSTQHLALSTETLAWVGLRELAGSLVPGAKLETTGDVARLLTRLHDLVETFCRFLLPLRDAGTRLPGGLPLPATATARRLARTTEPAALAALLLDWRNRDDDSTQALDGLLNEILVRQATLVKNVLNGVGALLSEISPEAIERSAAEEPGVGAVLGRYRALWHTYRERFDEVTTPNRQLELVFGGEAKRASRARSDDL